MYIEEELAELTKYKLVKDAYERDRLWIYVRDKVWWFETRVSNRIYDLVRKEMKRLFPEYVYLYDLVKIK